MQIPNLRPNQVDLSSSKALLTAALNILRNDIFISNNQKHVRKQRKSPPFFFLFLHMEVTEWIRY